LRQNGAALVRSRLVLRISSHGRESGEVKKLGEESEAA
jgi:hypothetical protein